MKRSGAKNLIRIIVWATLLGAVVVYFQFRKVSQANIQEVRGRVLPLLSKQLADAGLAMRNPVFIRAFKEESIMEVWMQPGEQAPYHLFRTYPIARYSGRLGPKLKEGDRQTPEGFYSIAKSSLNPNSSYHLSFDIGYPNAYDRQHQRTGSHIMVHGSNVSIGCFAMTDPVIEEIYLVVEAALSKGQLKVPVHIFPFRMTPERIDQARIAKDTNLDFWLGLRGGYDAFETKKLPPTMSVQEGKYHFQP